MRPLPDPHIPPRLGLRGITKRYPALVANDNVNLEVRAGEIHALLGENGAGKSTLMKIVYGVSRPDAGTIIWEGQPVHISSPAEARRLGIGTVQFGQPYGVSNRRGQVPPAEARAILARAAQAGIGLLDTAASDRLAALYVIAVYCGLRKGEALALRWSDLELDKAATLTVARSMQRVSRRAGGTGAMKVAT